MDGKAADTTGLTAAVHWRVMRPLFVVVAFLFAVDARAQFQPPGGAVRRSVAPTPAPARPTPAPVPPALSPDDTTRLQIFLERENFAPGKLDGRPGEFTRKAVARYAAATQRALPPPGPALLTALPAVRAVQPYARYTVTADDLAQVGPVPDDHAAQGKLKALPYTSVLELLAERFHAERDFLRRLNAPSTSTTSPPATPCACPTSPSRFMSASASASARMATRSRHGQSSAARGDGVHEGKDARRIRR